MLNTSNRLQLLEKEWFLYFHKHLAIRCLVIFQEGSLRSFSDIFSALMIYTHIHVDMCKRYTIRVSVRLGYHHIRHSHAIYMPTKTFKTIYNKQFISPKLTIKRMFVDITKVYPTTVMTRNVPIAKWKIDNNLYSTYKHKKKKRKEMIPWLTEKMLSKNSWKIIHDPLLK